MASAEPVKFRIKGSSVYVKPQPQPRSRSFDAASQGRRFQMWNATSAGANSVIMNSLATIRNRARDQARNNPWCSSAIDSLVSNVTSPAIRPISRAEKKEFRLKLHRLWDDWCVEADAAGILSFDLLVGLAFRSMVESGEVFIRLRPRMADDGLVVPLQLQIIESDHCPVTYTQIAPNGNRIIAGIEFDQIGRRAAYWMYPEHPGESSPIMGDTYSQPSRIPANEIIHIYDPARPGQIRGVPKMAAILTRLYDLGEYEGAELTKKKLAAMFVGSITSPAPDADLLDEEEGEDEQPNVNWARLEPGTIMAMEPGEDLKFNDPPDADATYEPHVKMQLRSIFAGGFYGITYEQGTGDLTGVNFSSIRAGLNEFQRRARRLQQLLIFQMCRPVWKEFLNTALLSGAIEAGGPLETIRDWGRVEWRAPGWKYVNPQQEMAANKIAIDEGLASRTGVLAEQGLDVVDIDNQNAEDEERERELGLNYGAQPSAGGFGAAAPAEPQDPKAKPQTQNEIDTTEN